MPGLEQGTMHARTSRQKVPPDWVGDADAAHALAVLTGSRPGLGSFICLLRCRSPPSLLLLPCARRRPLVLPLAAKPCCPACRQRATSSADVPARGPTLLSGGLQAATVIPILQPHACKRHQLLG